MDRITKIDRHKKPGAITVFLESGETVCVEASAAQPELCEGQELTAQELADLHREDDKRRIKQKAFQLLAARSHSEQELRTKLLRRGFRSELVDLVIRGLRDQGFVDDQEFARVYARSRLLTKPMGEKLLRQELWHKGLSREIVGQTLREAYKEKSQEELAKELAVKRLPRFADLERKLRRKKLAELLLRRGFSWELVRQVVDEVQATESRAAVRSSGSKSSGPQTSRDATPL